MKSALYGSNYRNKSDSCFHLKIASQKKAVILDYSESFSFFGVGEKWITKST